MANSPSDSSASDRPDVAIVGAGVSGLYTAWRLLVDAQQRNAPAPSITIFEMHDRVGGRLLTWRPLGPGPGLRAELGGMRFNEGHVMVWNLLPQLGFTTDDIVEFHVGGPHLRLLLRGVSTPLRDGDPTARYLLTPDERNKHAGELIKAVADEVMATDENQAVLEKFGMTKPPPTREGWDDIKPFLTWKGKGLWDLGFWNLMSDVRSPETYQYVLDAAGYYSNAANWNAGEAIQGVYAEPSAPHPDAPNYKTLKEGYNALPDALHDKVVELGCNIEMNTRLASFEVQSDGSSLLDMAGPKGEFTVEADRLFLAMPRRSLELLGPSPSFDLQGNSALKRLVETTAPYPAFKLFLFYSERWWEKYGIRWGRSISDLPLRQTYYFPPDLPETTTAGLLMASYDDERAVDYWRGLVPPEDQWEQGRVELRDALTELARSAGSAGAENTAAEDPPPHLHKATEEMLRHAQDQLALLHDVAVDDIPDPVVGAFADWDLDPFGGGWNMWAPQVDVHDAMTRIKVPLGEDQRVHVIGEAYSGVQGWVEGALTAAEVVLQRHLQLAPPQWLPSDYYLGW